MNMDHVDCSRLYMLAYYTFLALPVGRDRTLLFCTRLDNLFLAGGGLRSLALLALPLFLARLSILAILSQLLLPSEHAQLLHFE